MVLYSMEYQIIKRAFAEARQADQTTVRAQSLNGFLRFAHFLINDETMYPYWAVTETSCQPDFFICQSKPDIEHVSFVNAHKTEFWSWMKTFDCILTSKNFPRLGPNSILFNSLIFNELMWQNNIGMINKLLPHSADNRLILKLKNNLIGLFWEKGFVGYFDKVCAELESIFQEKKDNVFLVGGATIDYQSFDTKLQKQVFLNIFNFLKSI